MSADLSCSPTGRVGGGMSYHHGAAGGGWPGPSAATGKGSRERKDVVGMPLTDTATSKIKEMILDGRLAPGSKRPREGDLAAGRSSRPRPC